MENSMLKSGQQPAKGARSIAGYSDSLAVLVVALLSAGLACWPTPLGVVNAVIAIPALLLAPGYAIVRLALPDSRCNSLERFVFAMGLSIAITILCGIILNWTPFGLSAVPFTWTVSAVTIVCALLALWRAGEPISLPAIALRPAALMWLGLGTVFVVMAIVISIQGAQTYQKTAFTQLWLLPASNAPTPGTHLTLGVRNDEGRTMSYLVQIMMNGKLTQQWTTVTLATNQVWQQPLTFNAPPDTQIVARIFRVDQPGAVYRTVAFQTPTTATPTLAANG